MFQFKNIAQYHTQLTLNEVDCITLVKHYLKQIGDTKSLNAFVEVFSEESPQRAKQLDDKRKNGEALGCLHGVIVAIKELHKLLKVTKPFPKKEEDLWSYDVAHHAGLTLEGEYELLSLTNELQRQEYLKRHLSKVLPVVAEMESLKEKIKLNGHFKNLSGFNIS